MHRQMADMMKAMGGAKRGMAASLGGLFGMGGPSPEDMQKLAEKMPTSSGLPPKFPGLPPGGLPGLGGKLPGLGGLPGLGAPKDFKKK
jgi:signal recognition particle subunit SRP54